MKRCNALKISVRLVSFLAPVNYKQKRAENKNSLGRRELFTRRTLIFLLDGKPLVFQDLDVFKNGFGLKTGCFHG
jgi:hypothetical protein